MLASVHFGAKVFGFYFEIYGVSAPTRGRGRIEPVRTFCEQEGERVLCGRLFMDALISKGATREGAKGAEAPPLAKSKLRKNVKYRIVLIFFV